MNLNDKYNLAYKKLLKAKRVLVVGHTSPDPDALASMGAILELLKKNHIDFMAYADGKIDLMYDFIPHEDKVSSVKPEHIGGFDVIVILDCGSISRTALEGEIRGLLATKNRSEATAPYIIEFDHHQQEESYADLEIRLANRASTTEIIYEFFQANSEEINRLVATCILIGLMSDTGHFVHPNSSPKALEVSSQMLLSGASLRKISNHIRGETSIEALKIWGKVLSSLNINPDTKLACAALSEDDLKNLQLELENGSTKSVFGEIVSFISYLSGVSVALLLREEDGKIKGSLRANNSQIDVSRLAAVFGGGGHKRAAGFSVNGKLKKTETGWSAISRK